MTTGQTIAYYTGVLITSGIIFFILRAVSIIFLEKRYKKLFLKNKPNSTQQEIETDFKQHFKKIKIKLYVALVVITILIYVIVHK